MPSAAGKRMTTKDVFLQEYGSYGTSSRKDMGARNRQIVMYFVCGSALLLSIIALTQEHSVSQLALAAVAGSSPEAKGSHEGESAVHSNEVEAKIHAKSIKQPIPALETAVRHKVIENPALQPLKEYVRAKQKKLAKQEVSSKASVHAKPSHSLIKVPPAAIKPVIHTAAAKHVVAASQPFFKSVGGAEAEAAKKAHAEEVRAHIVHGKMLDDEAPADAPAPAAEAPAAAPASADDAAAEPTEIFHSPVGDLKPTGIMSVFFNENIMITAVCVIAFLLLAICCFARNADCALT